MAVTMFISLLTTRLILSSLGASDFGIFNIVGGAISMLGFLNTAMASATQRFMSFSEGEGNKEKQKSIFNISLILHLGIALLMGLVLLIAGWFFFHGILNIPAPRIPAAQVVYASLIVSTMLTVMNVPYDAVMNAHENMRYYALVGILESLLKLAVALACVYTLHDRLIVYGILMAAIPLVTLTIMKVYCHRHYEECVIRPRNYWNKTLFKEMTGFAGWNMLSTATSMVTQYGMGIILNFYYGVLLNAAQGIANQLSGMLMAFSNNALKALNPIIAKDVGGRQIDKAIYAAQFGCRISFYILGFFYFPTIVGMPSILCAWLKDVPEWAVLFCQLRMLQLALEQVSWTLLTAIDASGNIKRMRLSSSALNVLTLVLIVIFFQLGFGPYWMYIILIVCWSIARGGLLVYFTKRNVGMSIRQYLRDVAYPATMMCIIMALLYLLFQVTRTNDWIAIGITALLYALAGWFILLQSKEQKQIMAFAGNLLTKISH